MASTKNLGGVFMKDVDGRLSVPTINTSTENICGIIFDTHVFNSNMLETFSSNTKAIETFGVVLNANISNIVAFNSPDDIKNSGLDDSSQPVIEGVAAYHLKQFFELTGNSATIYVAFCDGASPMVLAGAVKAMQQASNGVIYQIGVWTGNALFTATTSGNNTTYSLPSNDASNLLYQMQKAAEELGGKIDTVNYDGHSPLNILVSAPPVDAPVFDYLNLVDLLDNTNAIYPKVSVLLGQESSEYIHQLQHVISVANISSNKYVPVGCVGAALACLAVAPAEESMAHVANFNLGAVISEAELGFGDLTLDESDEWSENVDFTPIKALSYADRNVMHKKGYIFLTDYVGINGVYFSSDQTLTKGDYRTIARCRVMHKSRRVVRAALLPYVNAPMEVDSGTGTLSSSDITMFQNLVLEALDTYMVEPNNQNVPQISGREVIIDEEQDVLSTDQLLIEYYLLPVGCTSSILVTEGFTSEVNG